MFDKQHFKYKGVVKVYCIILRSIQSVLKKYVSLINIIIMPKYLIIKPEAMGLIS